MAHPISSQTTSTQATAAQTDIAIIGLSGLFAGAPNVQTYWQNILAKVNQIQDAPNEWSENYLEPNSSDFNRIYTRKVGLLGDLSQFNPIEFGVLPKSVSGGEPDHFLALQQAKAALRDAGYHDQPASHKKTGVILGRGATPNRGSVTGFQYGVVLDQTVELLGQLLPDLKPEDAALIRRSLEASLPPISVETTPGLVSNVAVGRIANRLDLQGPSYMIDAACSSSLIAVDLAMKELRSGRCDMMLVGGVQASIPPQIYMLFCTLGALSRGDIKPFDQAAGGTLLGEGVGFLVLKRLEDAQRDCDRIYAILKQVGLSSDGKAMGLLTPRLEGEVLAVERAYQEAQIDPQTIGLIEAHGTGIPLGDRTEIASLKQVFGERDGHLPGCGIGSVKSMIGHCIPAAGIASLIKTALALYHKVLPPTLCDQLNPDLALETTPFYINTQTRPWIHGQPDNPRRAGVNAFGFGGINAHAILEEYTGSPAHPDKHPNKHLHTQWPQELLLFSQTSRAALLTQIQQVQRYLTAHPITNLASLACALASEPKHPCRLVILAKDIADLQNKLAQALDKLVDPTCQPFKLRTGIYYAEPSQQNNGLTSQSKIAFLFPGEGSQYPNMLADLCLHFPTVRFQFDVSDRTFAGIWPHLPSQFVFPPPTALTETEQTRLMQGLYDVDVATETVFTADLAMLTLLQEFGITADVMAGHSTGEYAALVASGAIPVTDLDTMIQTKRNLNRLYKDVEATDQVPRGHLLATGAVSEEFLNALLQEFEEQIYLAIDNCPNQKILFITEDNLNTVVGRIKAIGGISQVLPFDRAYHTPLFAQIGQSLQKYYADLPFQPCHTPLYSCSTVAPFPTETDAMRQLAAQQWSTAVRFQSLIERLYDEGVRIFIEVGANSNLTAFVNDILRQRTYCAIASNTSRKSGIEQLLTLLAQLLVEQVKVDLDPLFNHRTIEAFDLRTLNSDSGAEPSQPIHNSPWKLDLDLPKLSLPDNVVHYLRDRYITPQTATPATDPPIQEPFSQLSTPKEVYINPNSGAALPNRPPTIRSRMIAPMIAPTTQQITALPQPSAPPSPRLQQETFPNGELQTTRCELFLPSAEPISSAMQLSDCQTNLSDEEQYAIMALHFDLMNQFLQSQARVAQTYFGHAYMTYR